MVISGQKQGDYGPDKSVQNRLLDTAEQLFSDHGFEGTSVRDIAAAAGCNIAAVNYYFGGKDKLYAEVWRRQLVQMRDARLQAIEQVMSESGDKPSLEALLRSFANAFIGPMVDERKSHRFIRLMAREMLDQHLPANMLVEEVIKPTMAAMRKALLRICPSLEESKIPLVVFSIVGQLIHAARVKAMFEQTDIPDMPMLDLTGAVSHIVKFSAAGIRAYAEEKAE